MKNSVSFRSILGLLLTLSMLLTMAGCSAKQKLTTEKFIKAAEDLNIEAYDDEHDLYMDTGYFFRHKGYTVLYDDSAQDYYDKWINRTRDFGYYNIKSVGAIYNGIENKTLILMLTFENSDDAKGFLEICTEKIKDRKETTEAYGEENGCSYAYCVRENSGCFAAYCQGDTAIYIQSDERNSKCVKNFCKLMEIQSPFAKE